MTSIRTEPFAAVVLMLVLVVGNGLALRCHNCISTKGFAECEVMGDMLECNSTVANANHDALVASNPTLAHGNGTDFKCYRIELAQLYPNKTDTGLRGYARGCTFLNTSICVGWASSLNVTSCNTCTTDYCDKNPAPPTAAPGTTTSASSPVTGSNPVTVSSPVVSTTTTKPAGGGASVLTQISLTGLGCLGLVLVLAAGR